MLTCIPPVISYLHNDVLGIARRETKIQTTFKFTRIIYSLKSNQYCATIIVQNDFLNLKLTCIRFPRGVNCPGPTGQYP